MRTARVTRWAVLGAATAAAAVGGTSPARAGAGALELVVLYDDGQVSVETLDAAVAGQAASCVRGAVREHAVRAGAAGRLSAVTFAVPDARSAASAVAALKQVGGVAHAGPNRRWATRGAPRDLPLADPDLNDFSVYQQAAVDQVAADGSGGDGVTVAVLDGGFDLRHEMLDGHLAPGGYDAIDDDDDAQDLGDGVDGDGDGVADDMVSHGTFVSGLVLAVAPKADILPIRVLDDEGQGSDLALWMGVSHAVDAGADVINLSMVVPSMPAVLVDEIDAARQDGVVFVTAAGNDKNALLDDPKLVARSLEVGGVDADDAVLSWSPTGSAVEIYAPAEHLAGPLGGATPDSYGTWSGTSFACALVSGAAALLLEADADLTPAAVENVLATETATVSGDTSSGRLDIAAALDAVN